MANEPIDYERTEPIDKGPHRISGKLVLILLLATAIAMTVLTATLVGDDFDPTAKPIDSAISDRELLVEE
ncbi:MAG: hypothetical protein AAF656_02025 [Planctomycetota bacterium]